MKKIIFLQAAVLVFVSCTKTEVQQNPNAALPETIAAASKQMEAPTQVNFTEPNLFPEGIVYDKFNERFYVSSVTRGDIGIVGINGSYEVFIDDPALTATTGLEIDAARKRLLVANSPGSVGIYDTRTAERLQLVDLKALIPGAPIFVNDIALDARGNAYVTNSLYPVIYKITPDGTASVFFEDNSFATMPGQFGFNGIEYGSNGGGFLLVAFSNTNQIIKIQISTPSDFALVALDASLNRPDGLLLSNNGKELVVVNNAGGSSDGKILLFKSNDQFESATVSGSFATGAVFPTTATTDGKNIYVLYAYLHKRMTGQSVFTVQRLPFAANF